jgi:predicted metal-binding membrane protein
MSLSATRTSLVALLLALSGLAWWSTVDRMQGMMNTRDLGALGWFVGVWIVMMAAMMFPSVAPTVALYTRMAGRRARSAPLVFAAGYLVTWAVPGLLAYGAWRVGHELLGDAGSWLVGGTLLLAAVYELTPLKNVCLSKCRSPFGFLVGAWRDGYRGAFTMGAKHGAWCVGCCWALMAALFALGVMSIAWMAFVAVLIGAEKLLPWRRVATYGVAIVLLVLGVVSLA